MLAPLLPDEDTHAESYEDRYAQAYLDRGTVPDQATGHGDAYLYTHCDHCPAYGGTPNSYELACGHCPANRYGHAASGYRYLHPGPTAGLPLTDTHHRAHHRRAFDPASLPADSDAARAYRLAHTDAEEQEP